MLIGRSAELERIGALLDAAQAGHARALVLRGDPGIGKTTLLEWAAQHADRFRVLRATGVESEAELPCAGLHQLLRPVLARLDELPPAQALALRAALAIDIAGSTERFAVYVGTLGLLAAAAEHEPLLCLIEDAHWLDTVSAEALVFAARRLDAEPVAMLFAARTGERPFAATTLEELLLQPLDDAASAALLGTAADHVGSVAAEALLRVAAGNPLALLELPHSLTREQLLGTMPLDDPIPLSDGIEAAFQARIRRLSSDGRRALVRAAASESEPRLAAFDPGGLAGLEEAAAAGLVRLDGDVVRFRHPLMRAAAYQAGSPAERMAAHAALAAALADDDDELAWHLAAATDGPNEDIARLLDQVGAHAARRGSTAARARALHRAAQLTADAARRAQRLLDAAGAAFDAGQTALAITLLDQADEHALDPVLRADVSFLRWTIDPPAWGRLYDAMVRDAEAVEAIDPRRTARMLSSTTDYLWHCGRMDEAIPVHDRAWRLAGGRAVEGTLGVAVDEAWRRFEDLARTDAIGAAHAALHVGATSDDPFDLDDLPYGAQVLVFAEDASAAEEAQALVERARSLGVLPFLCTSLAVRAQADAAAGRPLSGYGPAVEAVAIAESVGGWRQLWAQTERALIDAYLGYEASCREHSLAALASTTPDTTWWRACAHRALGHLALGTGDPGTAARELELAVSMVPFENPGFFGCEADLVEAMLRAGGESAALARLDDLEARTRRAELPRMLASTRRCRLLAADDRDIDALGAEAIAAAAGWPLLEARARLGYGERLRRAGRRVDAREQLSDALSTFEEVGAAPWAGQARRQLQASGATLRRRDPNAADVLTPQELQVALYVADGRTNREVAASLFISPKTVELHLSRIYRKLGVRSRTELARVHAATPERLGAAP